MDTSLKKYRDFLTNVKGLSETTISSYFRDISQFSKFINKNLKKATEEDFQLFIDSKQKHGCASATISRNMSSLRSFYSYLENIGMVKKDCSKSIELPKPEKNLPQILTEHEISLLLEQPSGKDSKSIRDKAMLEILYATGIKVSELISLNISNVNLRRRMLNLNYQNKTRVVPLGKMAANALSIYIKNVRNNMASNDEMALFVNYAGTRMTRQGFWKLIKYYKEKSGIEKEITPHTLRHSFAAHLLKNGADIDLIGEMLGLTDSASTSVYKKIIENRMFDVYRKTHPRA